MQWWLGLPALLVCTIGCFQDSTPQRSQFLPLGARLSDEFPRVRQCRPNLGHGSDSYEQVLVNTVALAGYTSQSFPLPDGSVVLAELHRDPTCNSLSGFYLMAKEAGYDPAHGDWHWQVLDVSERVSQDGRLSTCSSCHAKPPCNSYLCAPP
jgi:hypothetical protein